MRKLIAVSFVVVLVATVGFASEFEKEIAVRSGGWVEFDVETGAQISIVGWGNESVKVAARISGPSADKVDLTVEETADGVVVRSRYIERMRSSSVSMDLEVHVPAISNVKINSMGGGVSIDGVDGTIEGQTMGGKLYLDNLKGDLDLTTMGGQVVLKNSDVDGKVTTMGGKALVEDVFGDVKVTSMGGEVTRRRVTRTDGGSIGEEVHIDTMGGAIDVSDAPLGAEVHTMGGNITIDSAREYVKAETMGGDIEIREVDGWVKATTMAGDIQVKVIGNHEVKLESMHGEVRLVLPDGTDLDIDIELAYTKNSKRSYQINSDFPINIRETDEWEYDHGSPRKTIYGTSSGGGNRIVIRTVNGNVYLTK